MNAEQLFRATLKKLAADGVQDAVLALSLAEAIVPHKEVELVSIQTELHRAHSDLLAALYSNGINWNRSTDRHINSAISGIVRALGKLS